jgi:hypothetical protein
MHGRIFVDNNIFVDKQRKRKMDLHYRELDKIQEKRIKHQKDLTKSTD